MPPRDTLYTTTPVNSPKVLCTSRLTSSSSGASPCICAMCSSKAIALSICGSPNTLAKPKARIPASKPTSMPRTSNWPVMSCSLKSVAREAKQVASVVHEFMDIHALDQRSSALLRANEINRQHQQQADKDRPRQDFTEGNGGQGNIGLRCGVIGHVNLQG